MKKPVLFFAFIPLAFLFASCATTKHVEPQTANQNTEAPEEETIPDTVVYDETSGATEDAVQPSSDAVQDTAPSAVLEPVPEEDAILPTNPDDVSVAVKKSDEQIPSERVEDEQPVEQIAPKEQLAPKEQIIPAAAQPTVQPKQTTQTASPKTTPAASTVTKQSPSSPAVSDKQSTEIPGEQTPEPQSSTQSSVVTQKPIIPSRSVDLLTNQYLDIDYPGTGWVYLEETDGSSVMKYYGRQMCTGNTSFTLRSLKPGSTILHFYKTDILTGEFIDDYLSVTVSDTK